VTPIDPYESKWLAWRPDEVARLLADVRVPWYVAGGWALELFLGGGHREHDDLEIAAPNSRFDEVADALGALEIFLITDRTEATPLAEARDRFFDTHQTWVREPATGFWRFDVFREPSDGDEWICRREPKLRMPYARLIEWTDDGIPYGRPEAILLMKAKHSKLEKNERDLEATLPRLDGERREWLRGAVAQVHPAHEWLEAL
jgi:Aminoglycoside-2''-adenylyltransferase